MKNALTILTLALFLNACTDSDIIPENAQDHFFVNNNGAQMPVFVRGNLNNNAIILFLHGGPGGNASQATFIPSFQLIEKDYAIAYWDQRASGLSQGNPNPETYTVEQFVEDANQIVLALKTRYNNKKIFVFGHSWGGALGAALLSTANYQDNVAGFICMNSGHNLVKGLPLSVAWVQAYAQSQIDENTELEYWTEVKEWCADKPDMTIAENYFTYTEYLRKTDAYRHDNQKVEVNSPTLGDILNSRLNLGIILGGRHLSQNFNILELNLTDDMADINIPSLVLWGKHDGVNTLAMGYDAFEALGTNESQKQMIILYNSAHEGYLEEPELFRSAIIDFVKKQ